MPVQGASSYIERIDLAPKLSKIGPKWRRSRLFSGKKSPHKFTFSDTDASNLIIADSTHFEQPFHYKTQKQPIPRHLSLFSMNLKFQVNLAEVALSQKSEYIINVEYN